MKDITCVGNNNIQDLCDKYCRNIFLYNELENYDFKNIASKHEILGLLKENTERKHQIYENQNSILEQLHVIIADIENMDAQMYAILQKFAFDLSQSEIEMDNATAFAVRKALLSYGEKIKDYSIIIEETYWCGICEWKYYKIDGMRPKVSYFEKMDALEKYLPVITAEARRRYIAGVINQLLFFTNKAAGPLLNKGREVLKRLDKLQQEYPDTPVNFKAFRSIVYRNMLTAEKSFREGIDATLENTKYVYMIAKKTMQLVDERYDTSIPFETEYYMDFYTAEFHAQLININEYLKKIERLCIPDSKYSDKENYDRLLRNNAVYITYLRKYAPYDKQKIQKIIIARIKEIFKYLSNIKRNEESHYVSEYVLEFVESTIDVVPFEYVREILFRTTLSQHRDTTVHNIMVQKISHVLLENIIKKRPEELIGVMGWNSLEEIRKNKCRLIQIMDDMALIHDIGKYKCISIISNASRKLDDTEFSIIKKHSLLGYEIVKDAPFSKALKDGVLLHHKWHNDKGGYPEGYVMTENRPLIDILCVADCLDAATDPYGRSYGRAKTLEYMIEELDGMKGTRYGEAVVDTLHDPHVELKLRYLLSHIRDDIVTALCKKDYREVINYYPRCVS